MTRPPVAWGVLCILGTLRLALHGLSSGPLAWGFMPDELYFLDCAARLEWGYVDHPPLSVAALAVVRAVLGESLAAVRTVPSLAGAATVVGTGLLARELGGGRAAQGMAALAAGAAPLLLGVASYHSMNALDPVLWCAAAILLARLQTGGAPGTWLGLGAVLGLAFLDKYAAGALAAGLAVGLVATPARRWLATPWPWGAAALALAVVAPHLYWQAANGWPSAEFLAAMRRHAPAPGRASFVAGQLVGLAPAGALLAGAGLAWLVAAPAARPYRLLAWVWGTAFALLLASGTAQDYYLAPAHAIPLAAGGVAVERLGRGRRGLVPAAAALLVAGAVPLVPLALPLLPPPATAAWARALGAAPGVEDGYASEVPGHLALRLGWEELASAAAEAHRSLPPAERERVGLLAFSFGEAGALNHYGPGLGLPPAMGTHNHYWRWGPRRPADVLLVVADARTPRLAHPERPPDFARRDAPVHLASWCGGLERAGVVACRFCSPYVRGRAVWICREPRPPLDALWPHLREYL